MWPAYSPATEPVPCQYTIIGAVALAALLPALSAIPLTPPRLTEPSRNGSFEQRKALLREQTDWGEPLR